MKSRKIEELRVIINEMISRENHDYDQLLAKSQELDSLILDEVKKNIFARNVLGEEFLDEFEVVIENILHFEKMYDWIRIVDPTSNQVYNIKGCQLSEADFRCYEFWDKGERCENCISMKAYHEGDSLLKLEYSEDRKNVYLIIAIPIEIREKMLVAEFIKALPESIFSRVTEEHNGFKLMAAIEHINQRGALK